MKKFNIQTIVLLFVALAGFTSKTNAQFASSNEVYCYQYDYSVIDGVKSRDPSQMPHSEYYFCIFGNNWEYGYYTSLEGYRQKPDMFTFNGIYQDKRKCEAQAPHTVNRQYDAANSSSSYYTYHCPSRTHWYGTWSDGRMYSHSKDRSIFIAWDIESKKQERHYYKRVDINSLKPNLDFLD